MDAYVGDSVERERLEVALARAIADGAVVRFDSLSVLLAQLPEGSRQEFQAAFDRHRPFGEDQEFFIGHVRVDAIRDGLWGVCRCTGAHAGYGLLVACDQARYDAAIAHLRETFARQQAKILLN